MLSSPIITKTLKMPSGANANPGTEELFISVQWLHHLNNIGVKIIGLNETNLGYPTASLNTNAITGAIHYTHFLEIYATKAETILKKLDEFSEEELEHYKLNEVLPEKLSAILTELNNLTIEFKKQRNEVPFYNPEIDFKTLLKEGKEGASNPEKLLAEGFNEFYKLSTISQLKIRKRHIFPTLGGAGGLHNIFQVFNTWKPQDYYLTPFPRYILYSGFHNENKLFPIEVMHEKGYRLTPKALEAALKSANEQGKNVKALLLCDPSNPLGTSINANEWQGIIEVLSRDENKHIYIIIDEAYVEMKFSTIKNNSAPSLLSYLAQEYPKSNDQTKLSLANIQNRLIILRSATKGLSAAGERMACIIAFGKEFCEQLEIERHKTGIPPFSSQIAYASAIKSEARIKYKFTLEHYHAQVNFMHKELERIGLSMDDPAYQVEGTFYILANLKKFIGCKIIDDNIHPIFGKTVLQYLNEDIGLNIENGILKTDKEIAYYLACAHGIAITPLSFFNFDPETGYFRITCSAGKSVLEELIKKLEEVKTHLISTQPSLNQPSQTTENTPTLPSHSAIERPGALDMIEETNHALFMSEQFPFLLNNTFVKSMQEYWNAARNKANTAVAIWDDQIEHKKEKEAKIKFYFNYIIEFLLSEKNIKSEAEEFEIKGVVLLKGLLDKNNFSKHTSDDQYETYIFNKFESHVRELGGLLNEAIVHLQGTAASESQILLASLSQKELGFEHDERSKLILKNFTEYLSKHYPHSTLIKSEFSEHIYNWLKLAYREDINLACAHLQYSVYKELGLAYIEGVKKIGASIPYADPEGNLSDRQTMANFLNEWYGLNTSEIDPSLQVRPQHLLFAGCKAKNLIAKSFEYNITQYTTKYILKPTFNVNKPLAIFFNVYEHFIHYRGNFSLIFNDLSRILKFNTNAYLIIDASLVEILDRNPINQMFLQLHYSNEYRERIILIRTATGVFSSDEERISLLMTFNQKIKAQLLEDSFNTHIHPPTSLVYAYVKSASTYLQKLSQESTAVIQQERLRKLALIKYLQTLSPLSLRRQVSLDRLYSAEREGEPLVSPLPQLHPRGSDSVGPKMPPTPGEETYQATLLLPNGLTFLRNYSSLPPNAPLTLMTRRLSEIHDELKIQDDQAQEQEPALPIPVSFIEDGSNNAKEKRKTNPTPVPQEDPSEQNQLAPKKQRTLALDPEEGANSDQEHPLPPEMFSPPSLTQHPSTSFMPHFQAPGQLFFFHYLPQLGAGGNHTLTQNLSSGSQQGSMPSLTYSQSSLETSSLEPTQPVEEEMDAAMQEDPRFNVLAGRRTP